MAKKSRRSRAQSKVPVKKAESRSVPVKNGTVNTPVRVATIPPAANASIVSAMELQRKYVLTELRRIGIIAGSLFVILIILTFVLG